MSVHSVTKCQSLSTNEHPLCTFFEEEEYAVFFKDIGLLGVGWRIGEEINETGENISFGQVEECI